jgi:hypothetical protein
VRCSKLHDTRSRRAIAGSVSGIGRGYGLVQQMSTVDPFVLSRGA